MTNLDHIRDQWHGGNITDNEALNALSSDLGEIDEVYERARQTREEYRVIISEVIARTGKTIANGYEFVLTNPTKTTSFDTEKVTQVLIALIAEGHPLASKLAQAQKESGRAGSLRVTKQRAK